MKPLYAIIALSCALAACGSPKPEIVFDTRVGPETRGQIKTLGQGLNAPEDKGHYLAEKLEAEDIKSGGKP